MCSSSTKGLDYYYKLYSAKYDAIPPIEKIGETCTMIQMTVHRWYDRAEIGCEALFVVALAMVLGSCSLHCALSIILVLK